ncbi:hypothetical protein M569_14879, partial [Genlisea aurea]
PSLQTGERVSLSLYYESLCPYCADFIVNKLSKIFQNRLIDVVDLRLIPWGNTHILPNSTWACQHGADECFLDVVDACAIRVWPEWTHFRFIHCVERLHLMGKHTEWRSCFTTLALDPTPLYNCYNYGLGYRLEKQYADETFALNPPHRFVPWVVVDGLPLQQDYQNFISYICKAYKGSSLPSACANPSSSYKVDYYESES